MEDDTHIPPAADPMAAARAAKAKKAHEKAEAELRQAEEQAASAAGPQPVVSSRANVSVEVDEGPWVDTRVTFKGHNKISTGGDFGFEHYARGAIVKSRERYARQNFDKGWIEPIEAALADKWERLAQQELVAGMRRKERHDHAMEHGVNANETWSTGADG